MEQKNISVSFSITVIYILSKISTLVDFFFKSIYETRLFFHITALKQIPS